MVGLVVKGLPLLWLVAMVAMLPTIPSIPSINRGNFIMFKAYGGINQSSPTIPKAKIGAARKGSKALAFSCYGSRGGKPGSSKGSPPPFNPAL